MVEFGKRHSCPAYAIEELGCSEVSLPLVKIDGFTRLLAKPAAKRKEDAFRNEDGRKPEQKLAWICPAQHRDGDNDCENGYGQSRYPLVTHEHQEKFVSKIPADRGCGFRSALSNGSLSFAALPREGAPVYRASNTHQPEIHFWREVTRFAALKRASNEMITQKC